MHERFSSSAENFPIVFEYNITGSISKKEQTHANIDTSRDTKGVRNLGDDIGWQTTREKEIQRKRVNRI